MELEKYQRKTGIATLTRSTVLRVQPRNEALKAIADQLTKLARLYQVPAWDDINAVLLAEWIMDEYRDDLFETVMNALNNPPKTEDKNWRLTPDTIRVWVTAEQEKLSERREKYVHNKKHEETGNEWPKERLDEWAKTIESKKSPFYGMPNLTEKEVREEGQERPKKPAYNPPNEEYYLLQQKRIEYGRLYTDLHTGAIKEGAPSFDEFIRKSL